MGAQAETAGTHVRLASRVLTGHLHPAETASILVHEAAHVAFRDPSSEERATKATVWWASDRVKTEGDPEYQKVLSQIIYYQNRYAERIKGHRAAQ